MNISAYLGVAGLVDVGYRFYTATETAVAARVTAGITDAGDGWYSASVTLPTTSASVRWDSTGTTDAKAREYWPDPWGHPVADGYPSGTAGYVLGTNLDATVSSRATPAQVQTELATYGALKPTTAGRTLDVSTGGEAGLDWANVGSPTTVVGLSGTTIKAVTDPVILTAAYDAAKTAATQASVNTIDDFLDTEIAAIQTKVNALPTDPADASDIAASFATVNGTLATIAGYVDTEVAAIKAKTDNLPTDPASASTISASFGVTNGKIDVVDDFVDTEVAAIKVVTDKLNTTLEADAAVWRFTTNALEQAPTGGGGGADPWGVALPGAYADGTAGKILGDNLDVKVSTRSVYAGTDTAGVTAIKEVTDKLNTMVEVDGTVYRYTTNALEQAPAGGGGGTADWTATEKDQIRNRLGIDGTAAVPSATPSLARQTTSDAILAKVNSLPADPADASDIAASFATLNTKVDTIDDFLDTEVAAIKAKTDALPSDPADASDIATSFTGVNTKLDAIDDFVDTEVSAIKAKTDQLQFSGAYVKATLDGALMTLSPAANDAVADAVLKRDWTLLTGESYYSLLNANRLLRNAWNTTEVPNNLTVKKEDGATTAWTRPVATDAAADPIVGLAT